MNKSKLITVIIPVYNKEKYLKQSIESVLNQSYSDLEIIIVNDGSTDNSKKICEEYSKKDSRISLINIQNGGAAHARNIAIDIAKGDFISFIDADDYIYSGYYEYMLNIMNVTNSDIAECSFIRVPENEKYEFDIQKNQYTQMNNIEALLKLYGDDYDEYVKTVIMCNKLFKTELFKNTRYIEKRIIDDETIIYKLLYDAKKFVTTNNKMYAYVQSLNSTMRADLKIEKIEDAFKAYDECSEFFKNNNLPKIQGLCLKRYLNYCIEFINKTVNSTISDKNEIYKDLKHKFDNKSKIYKEFIEEQEEKLKLEEEYEKIENIFNKKYEEEISKN